LLAFPAHTVDIIRRLGRTGVKTHIHTQNTHIH
jgi:hypothetical protein